jgi:hypothetical protein
VRAVTEGNEAVREVLEAGWFVGLPGAARCALVAVTDWLVEVLGCEDDIGRDAGVNAVLKDLEEGGFQDSLEGELH